MPNLTETDFEEMKAFLEQEGIISAEWLNNNLSKFKTFHELALSFLVWDHCLRNKAEHQKYFISETRSDVIHAIMAVMTGCKKAVNLLLRGMVENTLRHIYYCDHPIEFQLISQNEEYIPLKELVSYVQKHPVFSDCLKNIGLLERLEQMHKITSRFIHAQSPRYMQLSRALSEIRFDQRFFEWFVKKFRVAASDLNLLLVVLHFEEFRTMNPVYKGVIMKAMSKENKKLLSRL